MAAAAGAALGGLNPKQKPNPRASRPGLRSPGKPPALADITNTGRPNPPRPVSVGDVSKENAKLGQLLAEKTKIIELSSIEINKLQYELHALRQQNTTLARTNSHITAELKQGKDRIKLLRHELACADAVNKLKGSGLEIKQLQHELACAKAVIKLKGSGLERKSTTADSQMQKELASQEELNVTLSEFAPVEAHQADSKEPASPPRDIKHRELPQKRANKRIPQRRKTSRGNPGSCEGTLETEQNKAVKQNNRGPSTEPSEEQASGRSSVEVTGRRSSMRGAAKAVSYKEIPLNVKMRRP